MAVPFGAKLAALMTGFAQGQQQLQQQQQQLKALQLREKMLKADLELRQMNAEQRAEQFRQSLEVDKQRLQQGSEQFGQTMEFRRNQALQSQQQFEAEQQRLSQQAAENQALQRQQLGLSQQRLGLERQRLEQAKQPSNLTELAFRAAGGDKTAKIALESLQTAQGNEKLSKVSLALKAAQGDETAAKALGFLNSGKSEEPKLTDVRGMRQEFAKQSEDFVTIRDSFNRIKTVSKKPSPAGDLSLMFNYMKMLDPKSVVRESEFAQVASTGSFGQQLQAGAERYLSGKRLTDEQRADFLQQAESIFRGIAKTHINLEEEMRRIAEESGIDPSRVIIDYLGDERDIVNRKWKIE